MTVMSPDLEQILKQALALPPEARCALADSLLESLDTEIDEDAEAAWQKVIEERIKEIDSGKVSPVPWSEVRSQMRAALRNER
jgi:putative addiction module component (TIGR02574 family)